MVNIQRCMVHKEGRMGKIKKKKKFHKLRVCECCGNEVFFKKKVFKCFYCNYLNGVTDNETYKF